jgi:hypothetical protein
MVTSPVISKGRPRGKRSDILQAVLLTGLGAAVIAIAVLASSIQKQNETTRGLRQQIDGLTENHPLRYYANHGGNLPIVAASRRSAVATGYVLTIGNECTESLPLVINLENPASGRRKSSGTSRTGASWRATSLRFPTKASIR